MADKTDFLMERYKYVLARKHALNETTFKVAAIYQALIAAVGAGQFSVLSSLKSGSVTRDLARYASAGLLVLFWAVSALALCLFLGGIAAWLKYRRDEAVIELQMIGTTREQPRFKDAWAWYETYLIVIVLILGACWTFLYFREIVPSI